MRDVIKGREHKHIDLSTGHEPLGPFGLLEISTRHFYLCYSAGGISDIGKRFVTKRGQFLDFCFM